ncbi:MAG TPA: hypothetical protein VIR15_15320 [Intrasporangium sp.]|uniref:hypothetical protein n=1 Tax=Intrasporangium sp. TaxID=1925024 RepID=UPI002F939CC7
MAKRALRVRVEVVGSPEGPVESRPGRIMIVPPHVTFDDFGLAVDRALGRWDLAQLRLYWTSGDGGSDPSRFSYKDRVAAKLKPGGVFGYRFGQDGWEHECTVEAYDDPVEAFGRETHTAHAITGWGAVPDQAGNTAPPSTVDEGGHVPLWPDLARLRRLDDGEVRRAAFAGDLPTLVRAVTGSNLDYALQFVGDALLKARRASGGAEGATASESDAEVARLLAAIAGRLHERGWSGDEYLAQDIEAELSGAETELRPLPVDIPELTQIMSSGGDFRSEGRLNLDTGEINEFQPFGDRFDAYDDEDAEGEEEDAAESWTNVAWIESGSSDGWNDMSSFAELQHDPNIADRLARAIEGRGAFRRFRDAVDQLDLTDRWHEFSGDRELGRARQFLAEYGVRPI